MGSPMQTIHLIWIGNGHIPDYTKLFIQYFLIIVPNLLLNYGLKKI